MFRFHPSRHHMGAARAILSVALVALLGGVLACQKSVEDRLADVRLQQEIGSFEESVTALRDILSDEPDHPEANLMLGLAQLRLGQPALAIWPLEVATRSPDHAIKASLALGAVYSQLEQFDQAIEVASKLLEQSGDDPEARKGALRLRASVYVQTKDWDAAVSNADELLADDPEDPEALVLRANALQGAGRHDEAEETLLSIWTSETLGETPVGARAGVGLARLYLQERKDQPRAEAQMAALVERFPTNREVLAYTVRFFEGIDKADEGSKLLESAVEREPADVHLRGLLAEQYLSLGRDDDAEAVLVEATELLETPEAWITLAELYRQMGEHQKALEALERTLEVVPGTTDYLKFKHAEFLVDADQLDRAAEKSGEIESDVYRDLITGRVKLEQGDFEAALAAFDSGLRKWPNNAGGRYLAGKAALRLGDMERAISELREAMRSDAGATDAALELAWIQIHQNKPAAAGTSLNMLLADLKDPRRPRVQKAIVLLARVQAMMGATDKAVETLEGLAEVEGQKLTATVELAELLAPTRGAQAGIEAIEASGLDLQDPANEPGLRALCELLVSDGKAAAALGRVDAALAAHADVAAYHDLRGRVLVNMKRTDEAKASFEQALALDDQLAPAYEGMGRLAEAAGDGEGARGYYDQAAEAAPYNATYPYQSAQLLLMAGQTSAAEERLAEVLARDPLHPQANNDLAWILAERGADLERALTMARRAAAGDRSAQVLDTLGWVQFKRGEHAAAVTILEQARELEPAAPSIAYRLGLALLETGEEERARTLIQQALEGGSFPESEAARATLAKIAGGRS